MTRRLYSAAEDGTGRRLVSPMHSVVPAVFLCAILSACSSLELPSVEESRGVMRLQTARLDSADRLINAAGAAVPGGADLVTRIRVEALNRITRALADQRSDDVRLNFLPTRPIVKEEKSILGISYTNTLDIDSGVVVLNLKTLRFDRMENNRLDADLEIAGRGRIAASGRYTGIPASARPDIELVLHEKVAFELRATDTGTVEFRPVPKTLTLKARFTVKLLEWGIPWSEDVPLQLADLVKPFVLPVALQTEIGFPVPSANLQSGTYEFVPHILQFSRASVSARNNAIELRSGIDFRKK